MGRGSPGYQKRRPHQKGNHRPHVSVAQTRKSQESTGKSHPTAHKVKYGPQTSETCHPRGGQLALHSKTNERHLSNQRAKQEKSRDHTNGHQSTGQNRTHLGSETCSQLGGEEKFFSWNRVSSRQSYSAPHRRSNQRNRTEKENKRYADWGGRNKSVGSQMT